MLTRGVLAAARTAAVMCLAVGCAVCSADGGDAMRKSTPSRSRDAQLVVIVVDDMAGRSSYGATVQVRQSGKACFDTTDFSGVAEFGALRPVYTVVIVSCFRMETIHRGVRLRAGTTDTIRVRLPLAPDGRRGELKTYIDGIVTDSTM